MGSQNSNNQTVNTTPPHWCNNIVYTALHIELQYTTTLLITDSSNITVAACGLACIADNVFDVFDRKWKSATTVTSELLGPFNEETISSDMIRINCVDDRTNYFSSFSAQHKLHNQPIYCPRSSASSFPSHHQSVQWRHPRQCNFYFPPIRNNQWHCQWGLPTLKKSGDHLVKKTLCQREYGCFRLQWWKGIFEMRVARCCEGKCITMEISQKLCVSGGRWEQVFGWTTGELQTRAALRRECEVEGITFYSFR